MKQTISILLLAASTAVALAQTAAKPATAKAASHVAAHPAADAALPPGVPVVAGTPKTLFTLRYQDVKIGTGADAVPGKLYKVHYTGWLASNGHKFDSSYDHTRPFQRDKDGNAVLDSDGLPKLEAVQPFSFMQGAGQVIAGWDKGFEGMKVGGKRRLFIPYQLAYGEAGRPGIPAKSDLIFDIELVEIGDQPAPAPHPAANTPHPAPSLSAKPGAPATPAPAASATPSAAPAIAKPAAASAAAPAATTPATPATAQPQSK
jgi:peptidylprolyl isomerase